MLEAGNRLREVLEEIQSRKPSNEATALGDHHSAPFYDPWATR
jgi:hypothetical protein